MLITTYAKLQKVKAWKILYNLASRLDYLMQTRWVKQLQKLDLDHVSNMKLSNHKHQKTRAYDIQMKRKLDGNVDLPKILAKH